MKDLYIIPSQGIDTTFYLCDTESGEKKHK